jgi:hypothetical protein
VDNKELDMNTRTARGIPMSYGEYEWRKIAVESIIGGAFTAIGTWFAVRYLIGKLDKKKT